MLYRDVLTEIYYAALVTVLCSVYVDMTVRFILVGSCSVQAETRSQTGVFVGRVKSAGLYLAAAGILEKERLLHASGMWMSVYEMCFIYCIFTSEKNFKLLSLLLSP